MFQQGKQLSKSRNKPQLSAREVLTFHIFADMQQKGQTEQFELLRELVSHIDGHNVHFLYLKYVGDERLMHERQQ